MRLSNKRKAPIYNFTHTVLLMILIGGISIFLFEKLSYKKFGIEEYLLIIVPLSIIGIFYARGRQIFEFDSDGEELSLKNKHILPYFFAPVSDEFPKYKLVDYSIIDAIIIKKLHIYIKRKNNTVLTLKYDISNLTNKEVGDLKHSLNKIVCSNKIANKSQV